MTTLVYAASVYTATISSGREVKSSSAFATSLLPASMSPLSFTTFTSSPNTSPNCTYDNSTLSASLAVFYSLFFFFGLAGNLFALWVFLFLHSSRNSVRVFLINCAVADLVLLACLPFRIFYHINGDKWVLGPVACKTVGNVFYMNMYISIVLLGLISLDRHLRMQGKGRVRRGMSRPWSCAACAALWGFSLLGTLVMISTPEDEEDNSKCFQYKQRRSVPLKAYFNLLIVGFFWLVFAMLVVSYARIASRLLRVSRDRPDLPNSQKYKRTAKKSFFVLFLFTLCFVPYHVFRPVYILSQLNDTRSCSYLQMVDHTNEVMLLFSAFNSCLDPILYFLLSGSVRKAAIQALARQFGSRLLFVNVATSYSSTTEFRRPSVPLA
ncbi:probable G-protein coupled receptor 34 [Betta splendens]|uniref:Probable G-protein coupled receptor 34 n=1 Tax=Betta splendens TaxID=158456 RepID=A0A6P7Q2Y9_BETSP|nr:probable G-protein coupled receptor 34 [Betta splendens]